MRLSSKKYANEILKDIKRKKVVLYERDKNIQFVKKYNLNQNDIEEIIYNLTTNHFKAKMNNNDKKIKSEYLYYFKVSMNLNDEYGETYVYTYIKICEIIKGILVVSIHEDEE